jgi:hypothetical protein
MMILLPAYGRDYKSQKAVLADFNSEKDFVLRVYNQPDCYINKQQISDKELVTFRYNKLTKVFSTTVKKDQYEKSVQNNKS